MYTVGGNQVNPKKRGLILSGFAVPLLKRTAGYSTRRMILRTPFSLEAHQGNHPPACRGTWAGLRNSALSPAPAS